MALNSSVTNHWDNYQILIKKYLDSVSNNPYYNELVNDFKQEKTNKIINYFTNEYKKWIIYCINNNIVSDHCVDLINSNFIDKSSMELFCKYIENTIELNDNIKLKNIVSDLDSNAFVISSFCDCVILPFSNLSSKIFILLITSK